MIALNEAGVSMFNLGAYESALEIFTGLLFNAPASNNRGIHLHNYCATLRRVGNAEESTKLYVLDRAAEGKPAPVSFPYKVRSTVLSGLRKKHIASRKKK